MSKGEGGWPVRRWYSSIRVARTFSAIPQASFMSQNLDEEEYIRQMFFFI